MEIDLRDFNITEIIFNNNENTLIFKTDQENIRLIMTKEQFNTLISQE